MGGSGCGGGGRGVIFTFKPKESQENKTCFAPNEQLSKSKQEKNTGNALSFFKSFRKSFNYR